MTWDCRHVLPCPTIPDSFLFLFSLITTHRLSPVNFTGLLWNANQKKQESHLKIMEWGTQFGYGHFILEKKKRWGSHVSRTAVITQSRGQWPSRLHSSAPAVIKRPLPQEWGSEMHLLLQALARCSAALEKAHSSPSLSTLLSFPFKAELETFNKSPGCFFLSK